MGAACGNLNCSGKKHLKYPKANIIKRPTIFDLSLDDEGLIGVGDPILI
jgi:hypothetical protein